ncbi:hypothetical protein [Methylocella silvestris]|uniref:Uncharacterized protein n=1 Tax=Methylocella silvestris TaxID=199596 RepID=A0A2J7TE02_METSI|nr:hypothetical protein [Methylocella silvestris]PNG24990.1 hypothetical protein CR492_15950 [Methylocella silvestris]
MKKIIPALTAAFFLGGLAVAGAAPIPSSSVTTLTSVGDSGVVAQTAYHKKKNMKKVHKAQGRGR